MSDLKYGEVDWNEGSVAGGGSEFMKLEQGDNVVRIFTKPHQFHVCWLKDVSGANKKLRSAMKDCPLVKRGEKIQTRWLVGVINRNKGRAEILEIGSQIYKGIKNLINDPDWGDPTNYDVNIKRGRPGENPLYGVLSKPHKKLTEEDASLIAEFSETTDLKKLTMPPTAEEVAQRLAEIEGVAPSSGGGNGVSGQAAKPSGAPIDDSTFNFDEGGASL